MCWEGPELKCLPALFSRTRGSAYKRISLWSFKWRTISCSPGWQVLRSVRTERDCKACRRGKLLFSLNCSDCPSYFGGVETRHCCGIFSCANWCSAPQVSQSNSSPFWEYVKDKQTEDILKERWRLRAASFLCFQSRERQTSVGLQNPSWSQRKIQKLIKWLMIVPLLFTLLCPDLDTMGSAGSRGTDFRACWKELAIYNSA